MRLLTIIALLTLPLGLLQAGEIVIDDFGYADDAAAQAAWRPDQGSPPVKVMDHDGGKALRMDCPFTQEVERSVYDRAVNLNLSQVGQFTLDYYVDDVKPLRGFSLYFRSGEGWYGAGFNGEKGWNEITLLKSDFRTEDKPAGWDQISGFRLSQWKNNAGDTFVGIDNLKAYSSEIAVVLSTKSAAGNEARSVQSFAEGTHRLLHEAGIMADLISDEDVLGGALEGRRVAIFAYAPGMDPQVAEAAKQFVAGGGKVFQFYSIEAGMADALGVRTTGWKPAGDANTFAKVAFEAADIPGLPAIVGQDSWNANLVQPARPDARVIGWWTTPDGQRTGEPAMILSDSGAYMGHVLTGADSENKAQMLTALIGLFVPEVWTRKAERSLKVAAQIGPFAALPDLQAYVAGYGDKPQAALKAGEDSLKAAQAAFDADKGPESCELAMKARESFGQAYALAHRPRAGEFRAYWEHSGTGPFPDKGWGYALDILKANGYNAIVPNMWWAGLAYYRSDILPVDARVERYGDQIEQCVREAHARGIEVHAWKVNWNLGNAPKEFIDKLRAENRLAVDVKGEAQDWLCASNPANYQLEYDTMLEVARKYDVDGIHFDYIRYRDDTICYCDGCRQRFEAEIGQPVANWPADCYNGALRDRYRDFRCEQITRLVKATYEEAHRIKPHIKVSAAVFSDYPSCRRSVGQDWGLWVKEGYLDFVCPMDYTDSLSGYRRTVAKQLSIIGGRIPFYPGIGASAPGIPADQALAQAEIARDLGADGFTIFQLDRTTALSHAPAMGEALLTGGTYTPNAAPKIVFEMPGEVSPDDGAVHVAKGKPTTIGLARVETWGAYRKEAKQILASVELQRTDGSTVEKLKAVAGGLMSGPLAIEPHDGRLRIAVLGTLKFADGTEQPYIVRSPTFVFDQ
jgi:uncharacterized lipoprotein YddW (UPF0748 family)